jgi:flagellar biosynthesis protein
LVVWIISTWILWCKMQRRYQRVKTSLPTHPAQITAAAIRYDEETENAPEVVAVGKGKTAEKIIELAQEYGIPIYDDPLLAEALSEINPGDEIPPELYTLVAEVLAFIYRTYRHSIHLKKID